jgi:hypothetical protein
MNARTKTRKEIISTKKKELLGNMNELQSLKVEIVCESDDEKTITTTTKTNNSITSKGKGYEELMKAIDTLPERLQSIPPTPTKKTAVEISPFDNDGRKRSVNSIFGSIRNHRST